MKPITLLIKPVGGACNLQCGYCFYRGHGGGVIERETLERALSSYGELPFAAKSVMLQGGEPLLAPGYVFDAVEAFPAERGIQTNATLLTRAMAERLATGAWLVGVSLDGPREIHEAARGESFDAVVAGVRALEAVGADYNFLTVASRVNVGRGVEVYRFLRDNFATRFHQYIECTGPRAELAIAAEDWGRFLIAVFDEWAAHDSRDVSVRLFDSIAATVLRGAPLQCSFARDCRHHVVVEWDGSVYPCDFHVRREFLLGNVKTQSLREMLDSHAYRRFAEAKTANLPQKCRDCEFLDFCNGDCPRNRLSLCDGWRTFFRHAVERIAIDALEGNMV